MLVVLIAYLALAVLAGTMLTFVSRMPWQLEGRLAAGVVLGFSAAAMLTWIAAIPIGMSGISVAAGAFLLLAVVAACAYRTEWRAPLRAEWTAATQRWRSPACIPLLGLLVLAVAFFVPFYLHALEFRPDGLYAGYVNIWGDWCTHLAMAGYLSQAHTVLPPDNPFFHGVKLTYPFLPDLFSGILLHLGLDLEASLPLASAIMSIALVVVFHSTAQRLIGGRWGAAVAVLVFFLGGGVGFLGIFAAGNAPTGLLDAVLHPVKEYTLDRQVGYQWLNPILAYLVPQRATLFGFGLGMIVVALAWYGRATGARREMLLAGILLGLLPLLHTSTYFDLALFFTAVAAVDLAYGYVRERGFREPVARWAVMLVPAALLGLPQVVLILPPAAYAPSFLRVQVGWLSTTSDYSINIVAFWLLNTALLIPLALSAFFLDRGGKPGLVRFLAPAWVLFLLPNFVILQPWDWDNTKWFIWWAALAAILSGVVLSRLGRRGPVLAAVAVLMVVVTTASGTLDVVRASQKNLPNVSFRLLDNDELRVAQWARTSTPDTAVFLTGWQNNHPILTLSHREIVMGYPGWIWTWGLPPNQRQADVVAMYHGTDRTESLLREYQVSYVVIGPAELDPSGPGANLAYFQDHHHLVFRSQEYEVFSVS